VRTQKLTLELHKMWRLFCVSGGLSPYDKQLYTMELIGPLGRIL